MAASIPSISNNGDALTAPRLIRFAAQRGNHVAAELCFGFDEANAPRGGNFAWRVVPGLGGQVLQRETPGRSITRCRNSTGQPATQAQRYDLESTIVAKSPNGPD
jgi:hypothetical protein